MTGWFDMSKSSDDQFMIDLKAGNAETILTSELYKAKNSAETGIASVQSNCSIDGSYERLDARNGKHYFNLKAANHQIIGTSQMYESAQSCEKGIESEKTNGASKIVKDKT
jgi:hypothetical protein